VANKSQNPPLVEKEVPFWNTQKSRKNKQKSKYGCKSRRCPTVLVSASRNSLERDEESYSWAISTQT
jgi:hypothetical protein